MRRSISGMLIMEERKADSVSCRPTTSAVSAMMVARMVASLVRSPKPREAHSLKPQTRVAKERTTSPTATSSVRSSVIASSAPSKTLDLGMKP
jgi:hypothetical protein